MEGARLVFSDWLCATRYTRLACEAWDNGRPATQRNYEFVDADRR